MDDDMERLPSERRRYPDLKDAIGLVAYRQDRIVEKIDKIEGQVARAAFQIEDINNRMHEYKVWQECHMEATHNLIELKDELADVVAASKWLRASRNIIMVVGGAIIGILLFYDSVIHAIENFRGG
jgi:hypothetical protein